MATGYFKGTVSEYVDWSLWYFHCVYSCTQTCFIIKKTWESHFKQYGTFRQLSCLICQTARNNPFSSVTRCLHHWRKNSEGSLSVLHNSPNLGLHARLLGFYYTIITVTLDLSAQRHTQTVISSQNSTDLSFSALPTHFIQLIHDTNLNVQSPHKCSGLSKRHTNSMSLR